MTMNARPAAAQRRSAGGTVCPAWVVAAAFLGGTAAIAEEILDLPQPVAAAPEPMPPADAAPKHDTAAPQAGKDAASPKAAKPTRPDNDCCGRPGMVPVCRRVPVTRKKTHTEYDTKCELVCVPGCGLLHGHHVAGHGHRGAAAGCCDDGCTDCGDMRIRQKHTLLKRVTEKEYDTYEYKIEWVCASCAFGHGCCGPTPAARPTGLLGWLTAGE